MHAPKYPRAAAGNDGEGFRRPGPGPLDPGAVRPRRVGILGGSFDPVHLGHLHVARSAQRAAGLDRVVFVPAAQPPHKPGRRLAEGAHRVAMLELALRGESSWRIDPLELSRAGLSYTRDTLREIRSTQHLRADDELFLILGSDNLPGFPHWRAAEEIVELAQPLIVARDTDVDAVLARVAGVWSAARVERLRAGIIREPLCDVASTQIREALARGEMPADRLPPGVAEYIAARGIYGPNPRDRAAP